MSKIWKVVMYAGSGILVVALAYVLGVEAGNYLNQGELDKARQEGDRMTAGILEQMGTLAVGDKLEDFAFQDIDGNTLTLSMVATERCLISYMMPDCGGCLTEIAQIEDAVGKNEDFRYFIFISPADPEILSDVRTEHELGCIFLHDEESRFGGRYGIYTFPFSMVVNKDLEILKFYGGSMFAEDFESIIDAND